MWAIGGEEAERRSIHAEKQLIRIKEATKALNHAARLLQEQYKHDQNIW